MVEQFFVGVLASGAEGDDAAPFFTEATQQFVAHLQSVRVVVRGEEDGLLVAEMAFDEAVQPGGVGVASGGHGDDGGESYFVQGQGVYLSLHDVAFGVSEQRIEVVGDEFGTFHHLEALLQGAELGVHEPSVFEVVEADAEFGIFGAVSCGGGHDFVLPGHLHLAQGSEAQSPAARQVVGDGGRQVEVGFHESGADVAFGG